MKSLIEVVSLLRSEIGEWPEYGSPNSEHWQYILAWVLEWISENIGLAVSSFEDLRQSLIADYAEERSRRIESLTLLQLRHFLIYESAKKSALMRKK